MSETCEEDVWVLAPDADDTTRGRFYATMAKAMANWGQILTRTDGNGYISIILPPDFLGFPTTNKEGKDGRTG